MRSSAQAAMVLVAVAMFGVVRAHDDAFHRDRDVGQNTGQHSDGDAGWTTAERKSGHEQRLSMTHILQLTTINDGLNDLAERDATACSWMNQITGPETLARQASAFDARPAIKGVVEAARMTVRDYLLTLHAVSRTAITVHATDLGMRVSAAASASNVIFYRQHRSEIERLLDAPDPC